jgi:hypothetical protein
MNFILKQLQKLKGRKPPGRSITDEQLKGLAELLRIQYKFEIELKLEDKKYEGRDIIFVRKPRNPEDEFDEDQFFWIYHTGEVTCFELHE